MTTTTISTCCTTDELLGVVFERLDKLAMRIASSKALGRNEGERHADLDDLQAAYAAARTHQRSLRGEVRSNG